MKGVDLAQFRFDHDLTWAAVLLHPDGTVFARYGSRTEEGPMALNSIEGLSNTLRAVAAAHAKYPANAELFRDKRGPPPAYRRAEDMPTELTARKGPVGRENCIHCHNVYDAEIELAVKAGTFDPRKAWKYPLPTQIGLTLDPQNGTRVLRVAPDTAAAHGGLEEGDVIESLNGQAILSLADVQFVLHFLVAEKETLRVRLRRGEQRLERELTLEGPWREGNLSWRESMYRMPPRPGLWVDVVSSELRERHSLPEDRTALLIRGVFGEKVREAGLRKDDVIVGYDAQTGPATPGEFHAYLRLTHGKPGSKLRLEILRDGKRREVDVKF